MRERGEGGNVRGGREREREREREERECEKNCSVTINAMFKELRGIHFLSVFTTVNSLQ